VQSDHREARVIFTEICQLPTVSIRIYAVACSRNDYSIDFEDHIVYGLLAEEFNNEG
jgi:hypothetical protein